MTVETRPWYVPQNIQQAQYMNLVNQAWIPHEVKDFCRYIGSKATWNHSKDKNKSFSPCYARGDVIAIQMDRSADYINKAKKMALDLGWIQVQKRAGTSDNIFPTIGVDDPKIKRRSPREAWVREGLEPVEVFPNS
jgi:hypothetical protein